MNYTYLIAALSLNAIANIFLKMAAIGANGTSLRALMVNPYAIFGVLIFASNVYIYIQALKLLPISIAYPILTAAGFLIINTFGILYLKEPVSQWNLLGYAAILVGIALVVNSYR